MTSEKYMKIYRKRKEKEAFAKYDKMLSEGLSCIPEEKHRLFTDNMEETKKLWKKGMFWSYGEDVEFAVEIMKLLEAGATVDQAADTYFYQFYNDKIDEMYAESARSIVARFHLQGPEFYLKTASEFNKLTERDYKFLMLQIIENKAIVKKQKAKTLTK